MKKKDGLEGQPPLVTLPHWPYILKRWILDKMGEGATKFFLERRQRE
jgi:hypothetical protein